MEGGIGICVAEWMSTWERSSSLANAFWRLVLPVVFDLRDGKAPRRSDSVEVTDEHGWDFVPYPAARLEEVFGPRRIVMRQLKHSYWFGHAAYNPKPEFITATFTICLLHSENSTSR